ncbi:MAG TPA: GTPase [Planctomycetota bacterium]|nr:GTPase [Planctomycetota bacterium]
MLGDTIVALASAAGAAERAVLRISGPRAREVAARVFEPALPAARAQCRGRVRVRDGFVDAMALVMVGPASFTGEDTVELHVPGGPLLVQLLQDTMLHDGAALGVRQALPGEFTARACQNGRLDLLQAEGVLLLLHAADQQGAAAAVQWLEGGLSAAVRDVRSALQDVLATLEAGLDFTDGETGEVPAASWRVPLAQVAARLGELLQALPAAAPGGEVLLLGRANAGKSSLANAMANRTVALVDATPGTTRDLLRIEIAPGVALWDAPGDLENPAAMDQAALALRERLSGRAVAALCVLDASDPVAPAMALQTSLPWLAVVWTKCDLAPAPPLPPAVAARLSPAVPVFATSAAARTGLEPLRALLQRCARGSVVDAGGPVRQALRAARAAVLRVEALADRETELAAVELQQALRALDGFVGTHSPEQLLDRIYGRFCLGK